MAGVVNMFEHDRAQERAAQKVVHERAAQERAAQKVDADRLFAESLAATEFAEGAEETMKVNAATEVERRTVEMERGTLVTTPRGEDPKVRVATGPLFR